MDRPPDRRTGLAGRNTGGGGVSSADNHEGGAATSLFAADVPFEGVGMTRLLHLEPHSVVDYCVWNRIQLRQPALLAGTPWQ